jgi:hypothetical protein
MLTGYEKETEGEREREGERCLGRKEVKNNEEGRWVSSLDKCYQVEKRFFDSLVEDG